MLPDADFDYPYIYCTLCDDYKTMCEATQALRGSELSFNSVIASDDILAMGTMKYSKRKKLRIPEEFAIIGYNNSLLTSCCEPPLTSVDNRLPTLCNQLVKTLMGVLSGNEMSQKVIFSGELIKRGTTNF